MVSNFSESLINFILFLQGRWLISLNFISLNSERSDASCQKNPDYDFGREALLRAFCFASLSHFLRWQQIGHFSRNG